MSEFTDEEKAAGLRGSLAMIARLAMAAAQSGTADPTAALLEIRKKVRAALAFYQQ